MKFKPRLKFVFPMSQWRLLGISCLLFLLSPCLFFSCQEPEQVIQTDLEEFEIEHHIVIGQTMAKQIEKMPEMFNVLDSEIYHDAYIYVDRLVSTLKLTSVVKHRDDFNWKVTILHDDTIQSAFTLPGGHIYIYTGLLHFLEAEHELMAVLANEIAYADKELSAIALREAHGGVFLGDIILEKEVKNLPEVVEAFPSLEFSEDKVFDADQYAITLICPFQYDINGLQQVLSRANNNIEWLLSKNGEDLAERLAYIEEYASECGEGGVTNYQQYQRKIKNFLP